MASTLSYGFEKPATGDKGSVFFPALEDDIQQMNDHTHNGTNSSKLSAAATSAVTQAILSASWGASIGGGLYRQTITVPASLTANSGTYDDHMVQFRNTANGRILFLQTQKVTSTTYYLYINDNTIDVTAVYT